MNNEKMNSSGTPSSGDCRRLEGQNRRLRDLKTGAVGRTPADGVFIYIRHFHNTDLFHGRLAWTARLPAGDT
jgi:hypothetical protein